MGDEPARHQQYKPEKQYRRLEDNTYLEGGAIASSDKAIEDGKNTLTTQTLTVAAIQNKAEYSGSSIGIGLSYSNETQKDRDGNERIGVDGTPVKQGYNGFSPTMPSIASSSGEAESTTGSAISEGVIVITDDAAQQALTGQDAEQTVAELDRDTSSAHDSLTPIFDEKEIQADFEIANAFSRELGSFLTHRAEEADLKNEAARKNEEKAVNDPTLTDAQRLQLLAEATQLRSEAKGITDKWGAGGTYRQIATALSAAVSGNVSGSTAEMMQTGLVNYLQQQGAGYIGDLVGQGTLKEGSPEHAALHAIVACAGAAAGNQNCSSGAMGAAASSLLTNLFTNDATEGQESKEAKRNLVASLVAGIGAAGDADITTAVNAATAAMDNNWLHPRESELREFAQRKCETTGDPKACGAVRVLNVLDAKREAANDGTLYKGITTGITELLISPVKAPTELINSMVSEGVTETAINVVKGVVGLPENLYDGLTSSDPEVRGKALVDALALGYGATQVAKIVGRAGANSAGSNAAGRLTYDAASESWTSPGGLVYGQGSAQGNRVLHVLEHTVPDPSKPVHSVFNVDRTQVIGLVDEAWAAKVGSGTLQANGNRVWVVDMGRQVGTGGQTSIQIVVRDGTTQVITAFPK